MKSILWRFIKRLKTAPATRVLCIVLLFIIMLLALHIPDKGDREFQGILILDDDEKKVELKGRDILITYKGVGRLKRIRLPESTLLPTEILYNKGKDMEIGIMLTGKEEIYIVAIKPEPILLRSYPIPLNEELHIIISKSKNILYFYDNGELVKKYPVATGAKPDYTPEGTFRIIIKSNLEDGNNSEQLGVRWIGLEVPFEADKRGPQGDKRAPQGLKYGIHGTNEPLSIGNHASGGCIRMYNQDVKELFPLVPLGTKVIIK